MVYMSFDMLPHDLLCQETKLWNSILYIACSIVMNKMNIFKKHECLNALV